MGGRWCEQMETILVEEEDPRQEDLVPCTSLYHYRYPLRWRLDLSWSGRVGVWAGCRAGESKEATSWDWDRTSSDLKKPPEMWLAAWNRTVRACCPGWGGTHCTLALAGASPEGHCFDTGQCQPHTGSANASAGSLEECCAQPWGHNWQDGHSQACLSCPSQQLPEAHRDTSSLGSTPTLVLQQPLAGAMAQLWSQCQRPLATCATWSSFHYRTFDRCHYHFLGHCTYLLAGAADSTWAVHLSPRGHCAQRSARHCELARVMMGQEDVLIQDGNVSVNGQLVPDGESQLLPGLSLQWQGDWLVLSGVLGVVVRLDRSSLISVSVDHELQGQTQGLCGVYNGWREDDFLELGGRLAALAATFGNSWRLPASEVSPAEYHEACLFAYYAGASAGSGREGAVCATLATYAQDCAKQHIHMLWRKPGFCGRAPACPSQPPLSAGLGIEGGPSCDPYFSSSLVPIERLCPGDQLYWECASACPPSCSAVDEGGEGSCGEECVSSCQCPPRLFWDGAICVPAACCPSYHPLRHYGPDDTVRQRCNPCVCQDGRWLCAQAPCPSECAVGGDGHYLTFDGRSFSFCCSPGCCSILVQDLATGQLLIVLEHGADSGNCLHAISVTLADTYIQLRDSGSLSSPGAVLADGQDMGLPWSSPAGLSVSQASSTFLLLRWPGAQALWGVTDPAAYINLDPHHAHQVQGLGTFTWNQQDDFLTPAGDMETSTVAFASKFQLAGEGRCLPEDSTPFPCSTHSQHHVFMETACAILHGPAFQECHGLVDRESFYLRCLAAVCGCAPGRDCLCPVLAAYAHSCAQEGAPSPWRNQTLCSVPCPLGQEYQECDPVCGQNCGEPEDCGELGGCAAGCNCPLGLLWDPEGQCVPPSLCPCQQRAHHYAPGGATMKDCNRCVCQERGIWNCTARRCSPRWAFCPHELCLCPWCLPLHLWWPAAKNFCPPGSTRDCVCPPGTVLLDKRCVPPELCPCCHSGQWYPPNATIQENCNICMCQGQQWRYTGQRYGGRCQASGAPHCVTFDGLALIFPGACDYLLVREASGQFILEGSQKEGPEGSHGLPKATPRPSLMASLFLQGRVVTVKGVSIMLPKFYTGPQLSLRGADLFLLLNRLGFTLLWDGGTRVLVQLSPQFHGRMAGLCGDFDGDASNDLRSRQGILEPTAELAAHSWHLSPLCPEPGDLPHPCTVNAYQAAWARACRGVLLQPLFAGCHAEVPPQQHYQWCVYDACRCDSGGDCEYLCAIATYPDECSWHGLHVRWYSQKLCPLRCEGGQVYEACGPTCPPTSHDHGPEAGWHCQAVACVKGCFCPEGTLLHGGVCLEPTFCPYEWGGSFFPSGAVLQKDCGNCTCHESQLCGDNVTHCEEGEAPCQESRHCVPQKWLCENQNDCGDGSDEEGVSSPVCGSGRMSCSSGRLPLALLCDEQDDCGDGTDEQGCPCPQDSLACADRRCLPLALLCDGYSDCPNAADKESCLGSHWEVGTCGGVSGSTPNSETAEQLNCTSGEVSCNDSTFVGTIHRCDGIWDCLDGADEGPGHCPLPSLPTPPAGARLKWALRVPPMCPAPVARPVWPPLLCDGVPHCPKGSDEGPDACVPQLCLSPEQLCDGIPDCPQGKDKLACEGLPVTGSPNQTGGSCPEYSCPDGLCIGFQLMCNGQRGCETAGEAELSPEEQGCGVWGPWNPWGPWSCTCGSNVQGRCSLPLPVLQLCLGPEHQTQACFTAACPVNGEWTSWSPLSLCSEPCGGTMTRQRQCHPPQNGGQACSMLPGGPHSTHETWPYPQDGCPNTTCSGELVFWPCAPCPLTCDDFSSQTVCPTDKSCNSPGCWCPTGQVLGSEGQCVWPGQCPCLVDGAYYWPGQHIKADCQLCICQERPRNCRPNPDCAVNCGWSSWSPWAECLSPCWSHSIQWFFRSPSNPRPSGWGRQCPGIHCKTRRCQTEPCGGCVARPGLRCWERWRGDPCTVCQCLYNNSITHCSPYCPLGSCPQNSVLVEGLEQLCCHCALPSQSPALGPFLPMQCNPGQVPCKVLGCVEQGQLCDRTEDCLDGSDETCCASRPFTVPTTALRGLPSLSALLPEAVAYGSGECLPPLRCDLWPDCQDSSDEESCVDCKLVPWSGWSLCSRRCHLGLAFQRWELLLPLPGGSLAVAWNVWEVWGPCSVSCGGDHRSHRTCMDPMPKNGGAPCPGASQERSPCGLQPCTGDTDCGLGRVHVSAELCQKGLVPLCPPSFLDPEANRSCSGHCLEESLCLVGGELKLLGLSFLLGNCSWWSPSKPPATFGGSPCEGAMQELQNCHTACGTEALGWTPWAPWSACSQSCLAPGGGPGWHSRSRLCPSLGNMSCPGEASQEERCSLPHPATPVCPVPSAWGLWAPWSTCSATCGGIQTCGLSCSGLAAGDTECRPHSQTRDCNTALRRFRSPLHLQAFPFTPAKTSLSSHPAQCPGDIVFCSAKQCHQEGDLCPRLYLAQDPVEYTGFCAPSCACPLGLFLHNASCLPRTQCPCQLRGHLYDTGAVAQLDSCNNCTCVSGEMVCTSEPCPVAYGWSPWTPWSLCSHSCNVGIQWCFQAATVPQLPLGGAVCQGPSMEAVCNLRPCQGPGAEWGPWSPCSVPCGGGFWNHTQGSGENSPVDFSTCGGTNQTYLPHCYCPTRMLLLNNVYVPTQDCPCAHGGCLYPPGSTVLHPCENCSCVSGHITNCTSWACEEKERSGGWGPWEPWSSWSWSCGGGLQNPSPWGLGDYCEGPWAQGETCQALPCPDCGGGRVHFPCGKPYPCSYQDLSPGSVCQPGSTGCQPSCRCPPGQLSQDGLCVAPAHCCCQYQPGAMAVLENQSRSVGSERSSWERLEPGEVVTGPRDNCTCVAGILQCQEVPSCRPGVWNSWGPWEDCSVSCRGRKQLRARGCAQLLYHLYQECQREGCPFSCAHITGPASPLTLHTGLLTLVTFADPVASGQFASSSSSLLGVLGAASTDPGAHPPILGEGAQPLRFGDELGSGQTLYTGCSNCSCVHGKLSCSVGDCSKAVGGLGPWNPWGLCSRFCGGMGTRTRSCHCVRPLPTPGSQGCQGPLQDLEYCPSSDCSGASGSTVKPVTGLAGGWGPWSPWSPCSLSCTDPAHPAWHSCSCLCLANCRGDTSQELPCNLPSCTVLPLCPGPGCTAGNCSWTSWALWEPCSPSCGVAWQRCLWAYHPPGAGRHWCPNILTAYQELRFCNLACPVPGGWSRWNPWSWCDWSCGGGLLLRSRSCSSPPPKNRGALFAGERQQAQLCNPMPCEEGCPAGMEMVSCANPCPRCSDLQEAIVCQEGKACQRGCHCSEAMSGRLSGKVRGPGDSMPVRHCKCTDAQGCTCPASWRQDTCNNCMCQAGLSCMAQPCLPPAHCAWSRWSAWSPCSSSCGPTGQQSRFCSCTLEGVLCDNTACAAPGTWTLWSPWSDCPVSCGGGNQLHRVCLASAPLHGGPSCLGPDTQTQRCGQQPCMWPLEACSWGPWGPCFHSCGPGMASRSGSCPCLLAEADRMCSGTFLHLDTQAFYPGPCLGDWPGLGLWSCWSSWTQCSCQVLVQQLNRHQRPAPEGVGEGLPCMRLNGYFRPCLVSNCSEESCMPPFEFQACNSPCTGLCATHWSCQLCQDLQPCQPSCYCPEGLLEQAGGCVSPEQCSCQHISGEGTRVTLAQGDHLWLGCREWIGDVSGLLPLSGWSDWLPCGLCLPPSTLAPASRTVIEERPQNLVSLSPASASLLASQHHHRLCLDPETGRPWAGDPDLSAACLDLCQWSHWGPWSPCQVPCSGGFQPYWRKAGDTPGGGCRGPWAQTESCNMGPCPEEICKARDTMPTPDCANQCLRRCADLWDHVQWLQGPYHPGCRCPPGQMVQDRCCVLYSCRCGLPSPNASWVLALAEVVQLDSKTCTCVNGSLLCPHRECPVLGLWSAWSSCSASCGGGTSRRHRSCEEGPGAPCQAQDTEQWQECNLQPCPKCPLGQVLSTCATSCPRLCSHLWPGTLCMREPCQLGCGCPGGQLLHNGTCVPPTECPCTQLSLSWGLTLTLEEQAQELPPGTLLIQNCTCCLELHGRRPGEVTVQDPGSCCPTCRQETLGTKGAWGTSCCSSLCSGPFSHTSPMPALGGPPSPTLPTVGIDRNPNHPPLLSPTEERSASCRHLTELRNLSKGPCYLDQVEVSYYSGHCPSRTNVMPEEPYLQSQCDCCSYCLDPENLVRILNLLCPGGHMEQVMLPVIHSCQCNVCQAVY
ncbi:LOW QUALITY PROTEIN: SCO-spondin-like [Rhynchonycteris naso]